MYRKYPMIRVKQADRILHTKKNVEAVESRDYAKLNTPIKVGYDAALLSYMANVAF
ncbi:hypothetical protein [Zobellia uliginosa]|uniref:hypothetical protein n=1 Tax=Zobellia uliginosa TaxID=143224 RepID=UPI001C07D131|nr:hypothetical protein [Zobellia uliginosa]MBU2947091.1 hypothetical protein [Zobellia uliginosa]